MQSSRDEFAVETATDNDGGMGAAEIESAGKDTLVPKAEDFAFGAEAEGKRGGAFFGYGLEAPGAADEGEQRPDQARHDGQRETLAEGEFGLRGCKGLHGTELAIGSHSRRFYGEHGLAGQQLSKLAFGGLPLSVDGRMQRYRGAVLLDEFEKPSPYPPPPTHT